MTVVRCRVSVPFRGSVFGKLPTQPGFDRKLKVFPSPFGEVFGKLVKDFLRIDHEKSFRPLLWITKKFSSPFGEVYGFPSPFGEVPLLGKCMGFHPLSGKCVRKAKEIGILTLTLIVSIPFRGSVFVKME